MNPLMEELLATEHRKDIHRDIHDIHLEKKAARLRVYRPNWFTHAMHSLGHLLITQGERLVRRYETPKARCQHNTGHSYAH
jgi:hypothetical protein